MSHLLSTPFNKPSPLDLPRNGRPLTPPETDFGYASHHHHASKSAPVGLDVEFDPQASFSTAATEVQTPQPRKISYLNTGPKQSREKVVQRSFRWLVIVLPPSSFAQEHGYLGNTLSSGPPTRLAQGSLMPLYPTMSGQLAAIAREYNFPSIAGLCMYLHTDYGGLSISPRVSDDSWPLLWSHLFDPRTPSPPPPHMPIGGKIEFDIDLRKARWYNVWLAAPRKELIDIPVSITPSQPRSPSHWRGDSRTSLRDDQQEDSETVPLAQQSKPTRFIGRHVPRKLSLLDRFESSSVRSGSRLVPRNLSPPSPAPPTQALNDLSPIVQEEEPKTARKQLDQLVTSWRASASQMATPLAATGQTSLDPVNLPNTFPLDDSSPADTHPPSELNLSDFGWSVSSLGPPDDDLESVASQWHPPSVHLDRRLQGSVCLTPTTCTSWGPPDDDLEFSPISNIVRLPSPDIAMRMLEDAPPTPSTCTSWGPPSYPPSPTGLETFSRPLSIDLGHRGVFSRPVTPSTATSWGPPETDPPSPSTPYYVRSPDVGERGFGFDLEEDDAAGDRPWDFVWPYYGGVTPNPTQPNGHQTLVPHPASGEPWPMVWPYMNIPQNVHDGSLVEPEVASSYVAPTPPRSQPWQLVWPYITSSVDDVQSRGVSQELQPQAMSTSEPWRMVWPYTENSNTRQSSEELPSQTAFVGSTTPYPYLTIYPPAYPHFELYPREAAAVLTELRRPVSISLGVSATSAYPHFDLYPARSSLGYPYSLSNIYPPKSSSPSRKPDPIIVVLPTVAYPSLCIYPAVYPYNLDAIYPPTSVQPPASSRATETRRLGAVVVKLAPSYPCLEIYSPVYPDNLRYVYPQVTMAKTVVDKPANMSVVLHVDRPQENIKVSLTALYPCFDIYPAVYPANLNAIYPPIEDSSSRMITAKRSYEPLTVVGGQAIRDITPRVRLNVQYPVFDIYPPVYPFNLGSIYPPMKFQVSTPTPSLRTSLGLTPAYPNLVIYPELPDSEELTEQEQTEPALARLRRPILTLSLVGMPPPRSVARAHARENTSRSFLSQNHLKVPPVPPLPQNLQRLRPISPVSRLPLTGERVGMSLPVHLPFTYPAICPYPPVYPVVSVYPEAAVPAIARPTNTIKVSVEVKLNYSYPNVAPYSPVYPHLEIYPPTGATRPSIQPIPTKPIEKVVPTPSLAVRRQPRHTHLELHNQVFGPSVTPPRARGTRQLPSTPPVATIPVDSPSPTPSPTPSPPARPYVPQPLSRSSTMTVRSRLPVPPRSENPARLSRQLPTVPGSGHGIQGLRGPPPRTYGLPSSPSPSRRLSTPLAFRPNVPFSSLESVPEPEVVNMSSTSAPPTLRGRPLPRLDEGVIQEPEEFPSRGFASATLPAKQIPNTGASLSRAMSLPPRPLPRTTRNSSMVDVPPRGMPFSGSDSPPMRLAMSTLAQFPPPPRAPFPPNSRPVSKLDRSKYPFV